MQTLRVRSTLLTALCSLALGEDMEVPEAMNADLKAAIETAQAERRAEKQKQAAQMILDLQETVEQTKVTHRQGIRAARAQEAAHKKSLNGIDRALTYGMQTSNFLPILRVLGQAHSKPTGVTAEQWEQITQVPEDWSPEGEGE
jgi:hypothetical protein